MIYVIATITIKSGSKDSLFAAVQDCIAGTRSEPGCIRHDWNADIQDENQIVFVEQWRSREDLEAHFTQPHMLAWRKASAPHLVGRKVEIIHPDKVENL